ncbi:MAG: T9SS type A sorting domain-containing protein, partial [Ignavibacteria bacterium]|nr:T9SS type A sorting domain-containing protein [Ignavibacteria bacterium]
GTGGGVYRSIDDGSTWMPVNNGFPSPSGIDVHTLASNSAGDIFAGTSHYGIFRSTDDGENWTEINNGLPIYPDVRTILIDDSDHLFAGIVFNGVYSSTDNGDNWFSLGIPGTIVNSLIINSSGQIFAGTNGDGVFITTDNGVSWDQINSGLTDMNVISLGVDSDDFVYVGTYSGVFKSTSPTTEVLNPSDIFVPTNFSLKQNYPNPFNPSTKISWQVPVGCWQTLKVYDVLGNEVATLVDEYKPAGSYEVEFNSHSDVGRNLTSGIYFYQLKTESFVQTKKMILMK